MASKYPKLKDDQSLTIDTKDEFLRFACCDCGLVHDLGIAVFDDKRVVIAFRRHSRATGQLRRHKYGNLFKDRKG